MEKHKEQTYGWTDQKARCNFAGWWDCSFFCNKLSTGERVIPCYFDVPDFEKCNIKYLKNILFVCKANRNRSVAGERLFGSMLKEKGYRVFDPRDEKTWKDCNVKVSSAGIYPFNNEGKKLEGKAADTADLIFTFEESLEYALIHAFFQPKEKIVNLDIPDHYDIDNDSDEYNLRRILRKKLALYIPLP